MSEAYGSTLNIGFDVRGGLLMRQIHYWAALLWYPLVLDLAAGGIQVAVTCRVLGFSKQAFYAWRKSPVCQRDCDDAHLINDAKDIHHDDPAFGYRFIADELAGLGVKASENPVPRWVQPAADLVRLQQAPEPAPQGRAAAPQRPGAAPVHHGRA
jgi:hypothetical protein